MSLGVVSFETAEQTPKRMQKSEQAKKRPLKKDYDALFARGKRLKSSHHIFFCSASPKSVFRVAAKKKIGNAVRRNWHKRRLRSILNGVSFSKDYFVLGVVLRGHDLSFEEEKKIVCRSLRSIISS